MDLQQMGRALVIAGLALAVVGGLVMLVGRSGGGWRVPGDIVVRRPGFSFYLPLGTSILLSVLLTLGALVFRLWRR